MLKDEIEQRFARLLVREGISHDDMKAILNSPNPRDYANRLKPYIRLFGEEVRKREATKRRLAVPTS